MSFIICSKWVLNILQHSILTTFRTVKRLPASFVPHPRTLPFLFFQRQHFLSCYWTMKSPALLHHDPSLAYLEQYQLGFQQFSVLFSLLEPWAFCTSKSTLSLWVFRLIDANQDGLINFKEFCCALGKFLRYLLSTNASFHLSIHAASTAYRFSHRYFIRWIFHK